MGNETWARVVLYLADDPYDERTLSYMRSSAQDAVRMLSKSPGYQVGYWGFDEASGTMAAITYWDSLEAIEGAVKARLNSLRVDRAKHGFSVLSEANVQLFALPDTLVGGDRF